MTAAAAFAAYNESMEVFRAAARAYEAAKAKFHARQINEVEFLAVRRELMIADEASNAAEALYVALMDQAVGEVIADDIAVNGQLF